MVMIVFGHAFATNCFALRHPSMASVTDAATAYEQCERGGDVEEQIQLQSLL